MTNRLAWIFSLVATTVGAGTLMAAEAAVVLKQTPLFKYPARTAGERTEEEICTLGRGDVVLPEAERGMLVCESGSPPYTLWHACAEEFPDVDSERYHVRAPSCGKKSCVEGYVEKAAVEVFTYEPELKEVFESNLLLHPLVPESYLKPAVLKLGEIRSRDIEPPSITSVFPLAAPSAKVWPAIIEFLSSNSIPFEVVDKTSGLLTTKPIRDPLRDSMVCATALEHDYVVSFNVFLKDKGKASDLHVNASYKGVRNNEAITCYSNGTLEKWVADGVKVLLGGS